jgi:hypothetical protein
MKNCPHASRFISVVVCVVVLCGLNLSAADVPFSNTTTNEYQVAFASDHFASWRAVDAGMAVSLLALLEGSRELNSSGKIIHNPSGVRRDPPLPSISIRKLGHDGKELRVVKIYGRVAFYTSEGRRYEVSSSSRSNIVVILDRLDEQYADRQFIKPATLDQERNK